MALLQTLQAQWDLLTGRWAAAPIASEADLADGTAVLQAVRGDELHRVVGGDPWASPAFAGTNPPTQAFGVRDRRSGRMVGVVQATAATHLMGLPGTVAAYALDRVAADLLPRTWVITFFALLPEARKSAAGLLLLAEAFRAAMPKGYTVISLIAEPALLQRYLQLGARPIAPMRASAYGGYRIPMVALLADRAHLEAVNSPLRWLYDARLVPADDRSLQWLPVFEREYGRIDIGVAAYDPERDDEHDPVHKLLSRGMDAAGVEALLRGSLTLSAAVGDRILARGDGGALLGVVAEGLVHVVIGERVVAALGRGEPFGEIAYVTGEPRSADLVAASPETRFLQLSPAALAALPQPAALCLWRNLAWCLARRLVERTAPGR